MTIFAVQYLENSYPNATPEAVRLRLRQACERLPISIVLLGWELPRAIEEAVAEETARQHAKLYRWQPLLTGDSQTDLPHEWATIGPNGEPISGYGGLKEFTFICPNRSAVIEFISERVERAAACGLFQGLFLDRIRFPSPSHDPLRELACFCRHCTRLAADTGLDLERSRQTIQELQPKDLVRSLLGKPNEAAPPLESFLHFRAASITRTVQMVTKLSKSLGLSIGLDCFSPTLTRMVGQDLSSLNNNTDWVKIMSYPRVFGPAGISFELLGFAEWMISQGLHEDETMQLLSEASGLPVPKERTELAYSGLNALAIRLEIQRGFKMGVNNLLAGIALVSVKNVHESTSEELHADLKSSLEAKGLVVSWDLWLTPLEYLDTIRTLWS